MLNHVQEKGEALFKGWLHFGTHVCLDLVPESARHELEKHVLMAAALPLSWTAEPICGLYRHTSCSPSVLRKQNHVGKLNGRAQRRGV